jgi:hypothetical protein
VASQCSFANFLHSLNNFLFYIMDVTKSVGIMSKSDSWECGTSSSLVTFSHPEHVEECRFNRSRGLDNPIVTSTLSEVTTNDQDMETGWKLVFRLGERRIIWKF